MTQTGAMSHRIPHRFTSAKQLTPVTCGVCQKRSWAVFQTIVKCTECNFYCHDRCKDSAPLLCGWPAELIASTMDSLDPFRIGAPPSATQEDDAFHSFTMEEFPQPAPCLICREAIWGMHVDAMRCNKCGLAIHQKCFDTATKPQLQTCGMTMDQIKAAFPSVALKNPEDFKIARSETLERRKPLVSMSAETLMRISRQRYEPVSKSVFNVFANMRPQSSPTLVDSQEFVRRVHHFRGHEYVATYLDKNSKKCQICSGRLGDGGHQCYQCKYCEQIVHKKCYLDSIPCHINFDLAIDKQRGKDASQAKTIHTNNTLPRPGSMFVEDFSNELMPRADDQQELYDYIYDDKVIGSGQYGVVKKGHYRHDESKQFAIKIIDKRRFWDPNAARKSVTPEDDKRISHIPEILQRELDILKKLDHENIIKMHHFVDTPTQTFVIMDLANSGDLLDYVMKMKSIPEHEVLAICRQVLDALAYLHENGIAHRDLKPENLLLFKSKADGANIVKLADFGFATVFNSFGSAPTSLKSVVGTPAYMAPEIVDSRVWEFGKERLPSPKTEKHHGYDKSADMWSLGVILYVCLGGVFPFDQQRPILDQIMRGEFFFPDEYFSETSDEAIDFICRLLAVNPRQRLLTAESMKHPWITGKKLNMS